MSITNIISALGNNNSIYPLLVRDCGIENVAKVTMTYTQNAKDSKFIAQQATRERIIDEYGTSAVWLGGIPVMNLISDKMIKLSGLSPETNIKLFKESKAQGIEKNIEKFKNLAPKEVGELIKIKNNKKIFINAQIAKLLATTLIPIGIMGYILPKANYKYTEKKLAERQNKIKTNNPLEIKSKTFQTFKGDKKNNAENISFKSLAKLADLSTLQKMIILDGGLTLGRVQTARNKNEKAEMGFKMAGMCYLNYIAPKKIEKVLNKTTKKLFGINTELDPKILNNKEFIEKIKTNTLDLPQILTEEGLIDYIDTQKNSIFTKFTKELKLVIFLKNGVRDPRKYVDTNKLTTLANDLSEFSKNAQKKKNIESFIKKAQYAKCFNIFANVITSSALLAIALPKAQFVFRKLLTGKNTEPGITIQQ